MSHNFRINTKSKNDIVENYTKIVDKKILNHEEKIIQKENSLLKNNGIKKSSKISIFFKNQTDLIDLEESYKNCMIYLENVKKQIQKNTFYENDYLNNTNIVKKNF